MAVTRTTSGSTKPKKPKPAPAPVSPSRGGRTEGTVSPKAKTTVVTTDFTKKTVIQREKKTPDVEYVRPKETLSPQEKAQRAHKRFAKTVSESPKKLAGEKLRAEVRAERQEQRNVVNQRQKERRQERRDGGGGKARTYTGTKQDGGKIRSTGGTKENVIRSAGGGGGGLPGRTGGGFNDISNYQTPASFDRNPNTRFAPLPGAGSEGGGGGGATVTGQSLSGLAGSDVESLLKGAKKGRRQKRRRGTE
jgi:hypothetical protein